MRSIAGNSILYRSITLPKNVNCFLLTLKELRNILLGQQIKVYIDHKNLTYKTFDTERVMRWMLILEEYNPELICAQGSKNIVADALSRLDTNNPIKPNMSSLAGHFSLEKEDVLHPVNYKTIMQCQQNDKSLFETAKLNKGYSIKHFHGADKKYSLTCRNQYM